MQHYTDAELASMAAKCTPFKQGATGNDAQTFYESIAHKSDKNTHQNVIADAYRAVMPDVDDLRQRSKIHVGWNRLFGYDVVRLNDDAARYLHSHYEQYADILPSRIYHEIESAFSCMQMIEIINGAEWAKDYSDALACSLTTYMIVRFEELRLCGLSGTTPPPVTRDYITQQCPVLCKSIAAKE